MLSISVFLVVLSTIGAVCAPWFSPFLIASVFHLIELGINPLLIIIVCTITATMTTTGIWFLDGKIHNYLQKFTKNKTYKKGLSWKIKRWFDKKFSIIKNKNILFIAIVLGSGSMIPDIFLVEFGRYKMKFQNFIIAIMLGKFLTYFIMIYGFEHIKNFLTNLL